MFCKTTLLKKGSGIPLVFLHGFLGSASDWEATCSHLPSCHCIGVDLPGHGTSPFSPTFEFELYHKRPQTWNLASARQSPIEALWSERGSPSPRGKGDEEDRLGKVAASPNSKFVDACGTPASKFHLIGYSMGGRLAMQYALRYPNRIARLAIISAHPGLLLPEEREKRLKSDAEWAKLLIELPIDEFLQRWYNQPIFAGYKPDFFMRRKQNIPALARAFIHYSLGNQPILRIENAIHIVGEKDLKFRSLHPNALVIMESGHAVHLEKPKELALCIMEKIL